MVDRSGRATSMNDRRRDSGTESGIILLFRLALIVAFAVVAVRLYQLQIVQGDTFRQDSDGNRFRIVEVAPPRGVIYDRGGQILTRNRPTFDVSIVPEDLPLDDPDTEQDEEALAIEQVLYTLRADSDPEIAIRIAELMVRRLGRADFIDAVQASGSRVNTLLVQAPPKITIAEDGTELREEGELVNFPDTSIPLSLEALVALLQQSVLIGRQGSSSEEIRILDLVDRLHAFEIVETGFQSPSLRVTEVPVREYIFGDLVSHVLGFLGPIPAAVEQEYRDAGYNNPNERVGLDGLEFSFQEELRGIPGSQNIEVDILGREIRSVGTIVEPVPGSNLLLNIDLRLQRVMYDELSAMMEEQEAPWGVTIAMDPMTGAVLGMVSLPSYDNNVFAESINENYLALEEDERRPLINYAIGGLYPPGSIFKLVTASAALEETVIGARSQIVDAGPIYLPNRFFPDDPAQAQEFVSWNHDLGIVHGAINVVEALALSNDIFFYWIGGGFPPERFEGLGNEKLASYAELFGYGDPSGIDLPGEVGAIVPDDQWKRRLFAESWTTGDSYNMSIGQGYVLATPLQVLVSAAAVANGGTVYAPQVVYQVVDSKGGLQRDFEPRIVRELPLSSEVLELIQEGMWAAVNTDFGTSIDARVEGITVAGKTGTAEFCEYIPEEDDCRRDDEENLPTHAWFTAYAPYEAPEIAIITFLYDGGEGSEAAIPVTQRVLATYFSEIRP